MTTTRRLLAGDRAIHQAWSAWRLDRFPRSLRSALVRPIVRELGLVSLASCLLAVLMTWPALRDPSHTIPTTSLDALIEAWAIGWSGHALLDGSPGLFDGNTFYPAHLSLAFTDPMVGYGPVTWLASGPAKALIAYNIVYAFTPALACVGAYALARQLGAHPFGAAVAGLAFAYAPWRAGQAAHLHVLSTGPFVLALAMLARGHGFNLRGRRGRYRPMWAALGWVFAAWQLTIGFAVGLPFAYLLGILCVASAVAWLVRGRPPVPRRLVAVDLVGGLAFAAVGGLMARPFLEVAEVEAPAVEYARSLQQVEHYSPTWQGLVAPPATVDGLWTRLGQTTFGHLPPTGEVRLLPGFTLILLALLGLFVSSWQPRWRWTLAAAIALLSAMALGTHLAGSEVFGFLVLYNHVPGWAGIRTPGRMVIFSTLGLALLAAGAVSRLLGRRTGAVGHPPGRGTGPVGRLPGRGTGAVSDLLGRGAAAVGPLLRRGARAVSELLGLGTGTVIPRVVPAPRAGRNPVWSTLRRALDRGAGPVGAVALSLLVVMEGFARIPMPAVPDPPAAFTVAPAPLVVLPSVWVSDGTVMYWSTLRDFPPIGNGTSGFTPSTITTMRTELYRFPDARSVAYLRAHGYRSVVYRRGSPSVQARAADLGVPGPSLGLQRIDMGDAVLFLIDPVPPPDLTPSGDPRVRREAPDATDALPGRRAD